MNFLITKSQQLNAVKILEKEAFLLIFEPLFLNQFSIL
jgi:hypothetical protein